MLFILFFGIGIDSESSVGEDTIHITIYGTSVLVEKNSTTEISFPGAQDTKKTVFDEKTVFFLTFRRKKFWVSFAEG